MFLHLDLEVLRYDISQLIFISSALYAYIFSKLVHSILHQLEHAPDLRESHRGEFWDELGDKEAAELLLRGRLRYAVDKLHHQVVSFDCILEELVVRGLGGVEEVGFGWGLCLCWRTAWWPSSSE